jgi:hypothetical protein
LCGGERGVLIWLEGGGRKSMRAGAAGGVPEDQIKDESVLLAPGAKDNDTVFVRKDGKVMAYVWSADDIQWSVLGEVTDGPEDNVNVAKKVCNHSTLRTPSSTDPQFFKLLS